MLGELFLALGLELKGTIGRDLPFGSRRVPDLLPRKRRVNQHVLRGGTEKMELT